MLQDPRTRLYRLGPQLLLALCLAALPFAAQAQLVYLDDATTTVIPSIETVGAPVITALPGSRLVTAQIHSVWPQDQLEVRLWQVGRGGELNLLDTEIYPYAGGWTVEDAAPMGSSAVAVAVRPAPTKFQVRAYDVVGTNLVPRTVHGTWGGYVGPIKLAEFSSDSVYLLTAYEDNGEARLFRWRYLPTTESLSPIYWFDAYAEWDLAVHGGSELAVVFRENVLDGENIRLFRATFDSQGYLSNLRSAEGDPVEEVDVTFTATGKAITVSRNTLGQTVATRWADVTLWPSTVKILTEVSSATAPPWANLRIEPLKTDWVATAGIPQGGSTQWLWTWDVTGAVTGIAGTNGGAASSMDFVRIYSHRLATVQHSVGVPQKVTTWGELTP